MMGHSMPVSNPPDADDVMLVTLLTFIKLVEIPYDVMTSSLDVMLDVMTSAKRKVVRKVGGADTEGAMLKLDGERCAVVQLRRF